MEISAKRVYTYASVPTFICAILFFLAVFFFHAESLKIIIALSLLFFFFVHQICIPLYLYNNLFDQIGYIFSLITLILLAGYGYCKIKIVGLIASIAVIICIGFTYYFNVGIVGYSSYSPRALIAPLFLVGAYYMLFLFNSVMFTRLFRAIAVLVGFLILFTILVLVYFDYMDRAYLRSTVSFVTAIIWSMSLWYMWWDIRSVFLTQFLMVLVGLFGLIVSALVIRWYGGKSYEITI